MRALPVLFLIAGCAGRSAAGRADGPPAVEAREPDGAPPDAGALRACAHEAEDVAPCAEDCDRGIAFACAVLAARLERGDRTPRDLPRAVRLHERACELRDAPSCTSAARMHASGAGVPPSRARQLELLAAACQLGDALACGLPARAYAEGRGVPRDERRAADLYERACAGGVEAACPEVDRGEGVEGWRGRGAEGGPGPAPQRNSR